MKVSLRALLLMALALLAFQSPTTAQADEEIVDKGGESAFHIDFHGYYRARLVGAYGVPKAAIAGENDPADPNPKDDAGNTNYGFMRLRLNPTFWYGKKPTDGSKPTMYAAVKMQIDALDNVVFGDNARSGSVPLFAEDPTTTNIFGVDGVPIKIRRLWLEAFVGIGQVRIGRQPSNGGLGLLFNDGNGFRNKFGDAQEGSTFDRFLFVTRPLAVANGIAKGKLMSERIANALITGVGYDWLVEDPLGVGENLQPISSRTDRGPFDFLSNGRCPDDPRTTDDPLTPDITENNEGLDTCDDDVQQVLAILVWNDPDIVITKDSDDLQLGFVFVYRSQDFNDSEIFIYDFWWRFQVGLGRALPSFYTEAEFSLLRGNSNGLPLGFFATDPTDAADNAAFPITGIASETLTANILNSVIRIGLKDPQWDFIVEGGYSSGDESLLNDLTFKTFPIHSDYKVGLVMYPIALNARTNNTIGGTSSGALRSQGSVWNSNYIFPTASYRPGFLKGLGVHFEVVGGFLAAWANTLNGDDEIFPDSATPPFKTTDYLVSRDDYHKNSCDFFEGDCFLGWEIDLAIKLRWLKYDNGAAKEEDRYLMRWSNEFGLMKAGDALAGRLKDDIVWTLQTRMAMVW